MKRGYTTGSCAQAAAKAAALMLTKRKIAKEVEVKLPNGERVSFDILKPRISDGEVSCAVKKYSGDDPDVTNGALIEAKARWAKKGGFKLLGGCGIGRVTKPGLQVEIGKPAINPIPRKYIEASVKEVTHRPAEITISVKGGRRLANKTFNPRLGIVGGISIIGTTGRVEPKSQEAFKASLVCSLDVAKAMKFKEIILVPGNIGER
ncbi:MAG: cobalt-precorrin-5B (C(1))-methyltransferase, partial [Candidatus Omnitrophica bacterium]|nr:cobalt-precorrin-5B (C(1))-methyltransferase [Candidatus Omnitrophota bacterium]